MSEPKEGKIYNVHHCRKGKFVLNVTKVGDEWITGNLVEGNPKYLSKGAYSEIGEEMILRISFCTFEEVLNG